MKNNPKDNKTSSINMFLNEPIKETSFSKSTNQLAVVSNNGYRIAMTSLPENFFENLLILEMELEDEFALEKLIELVKQYSIAIEYYLQFEPNKAKAYQNRMEYLLTNKDTLLKLKKQKVKEKIVNDDNMDKNININKENEKRKKFQRMKSQLNVNMDYIKIKQNEINDQDFSKKATLFLSTNNKSDEHISGKNIIKGDLENQSQSWKKKYRLKKKRLSKFNTKPNLLKSRYFADSLGGKRDIKMSSNAQIYSANPKKTLIIDNDLKVSKFNSNDLKNEIKEDNIIFEENEEKAKRKQALINRIKIKENENEVKNEGKEANKENKEEKEKKNEIKEEGKTEENKIDEKKEEKSEEKKEEIDKDKQEEKNEIIIEEKKAEDETKKDRNEIIEEAPQNEVNIDQINIDKIAENNQKSQDDDKIPTQTENRLSILLARTESMNNEELEKEITEKINPDEEIKTSIESQITSLQNIIFNLNSKTSSQNEGDNEEEEDSEFSNSNKNLNKVQNNNNVSLIEKIPAKFRGTYSYVEELIHTYMKEFNLFFYKDIFEQFSSSLLELYELKYKKYIEIRNEYHDQIKENEYSMENEDNLTEEKKEEYLQTIESLKEEQQHQIDVVEDEFNKKIMDKISEFKLNSFKNNSGIQLLEEKVKLDIYSLINQAIYN